MTWWDEFWEATTDPGLYYLENPIPKTGGTAILVPGQYLNVYEIDTHRKEKKGAHEALCQRSNKNVEVWRDNNKDNILDWEGEPKPGVFGINIHRANEDTKDIATEVGRYSAGCQVIANIADFTRMMELAHKQNKKKKTFTYTLLTEEEVDRVTKPSK